MADWTFEKALAAIKSPPSISLDTLLSPVGLRLGDIRFAKIQTNLRMRTVAMAVLEEWISNGSFNLHHKPDEDCSRTTAILIILTPNSQGTKLTYASVGLIIRRRKGPVGRIEDIPRFITFIRSQLKGDRPASPNDRKTYCMIVGDYGGPLAFATEPPFCTAYPLSFADRDDPTRMTFRHPHNHPWSFTTDVLLVRQLLARDSSVCEHARDRCRRRILIPRGVHLSTNIVPEIEVPRGHSAPYYNPRTGVEAPFFTMGPFASTDTLFPGTPGDLDLYTDMEISCLKNIGLLETSVASARDPHTVSSASKAEAAPSVKRRDDRDSPGCRHPVSAAAGSREDLDKSEHEREAERKWLRRDIGAERGQSVSKDLSRGLKRSGTIEAEDSAERPRPKDRRTERGRSHECRRPDSPDRPPPPSFLFPPAAPSHPVRSSISVPSVDPSRGSAPASQGLGAEVSVPTDAPPSGAGQLVGVQVGLSVLTSGLTAAQAEEIFLLSHEIQTLRGKLALDFIKMSHTEANFRMGAQAASHESTVQESRVGETWLHINSLLFLSRYRSSTIHGTAHQ